MFVAFVSKKGGVGKTTSTVSLAAALGRRGKRVLIVDLDPQASSSLSLGVRRADLAPSVADLLTGQKTLADLIRPTEAEGLSLVTASADLASVDRDLATLQRPELRLRQRIRVPAAEAFDYVFFDCPPSFSLLPTSALVASDAYVVPMTAHFLAAEGLDNLIGGIARHRVRYGHAPELLGILLSMVDYRTKVTKENVVKIRDQFGDRVFAIEVRVNIRLAEAPEYGKTIFEHCETAPSAKAFELLAEEFTMRTRPLAERLARSAGGDQPSRPAPANVEPIRPAAPRRTWVPGYRTRIETVSS